MILGKISVFITKQSVKQQTAFGSLCSSRKIHTHLTEGHWKFLGGGGS